MSVQGPRGRTAAAGASVPRIRLVVLAVAVAAGASGCVSLQANGPVVSVTEEGDGSAQGQIWPSPPTAKEAPASIVNGFLEAARSGSENLNIADDYLTADMQKEWQGEQSTVIVLADDSESYPQPPGGGANGSAGSGDASSAETSGNVPFAPVDSVAQGVGIADGAAQVTEDVQGGLLGTLDSSGLYEASNGTENYSFGLTLTKAGYRISSLPADFGVLMERSDFEAGYDRHDVYYENAQFSGKLIPAQVYLPATDTDQQLATAMTRLIVDGVPAQLGSALQSAVPGASFKSVQFGGDGDATVTINSRNYCVKSLNACGDLAEQLAETLGSLSTKVTSVSIEDQSNGQTYPPMPAGGNLIDYGVNGGSRLGNSFYAVTSAGAIEEASTFGTPSVIGTSYASIKTRFKSIAVGPPQQGTRAAPVALVSQDGTKVYLPRKQDDGYQLTQVFPTAGASATGSSVDGLSWDDYGDLWFTVAHGGTTDVYRYGQGDLSQVSVTGLDGGDQVTRIAAAPDGVRVAVGYKDSAGDAWIAIASAASDSDGNWTLQLGGAEPVATDWDQVNDFDWYNEDSLAVLGIQPNSQSLGLYQIYADGSSVYDSLTDQPVEASPPPNADHFVWNSAGNPIASAFNNDKDMLYQLSVEGQDAQVLTGVFGTSPSY